jgi:DNA-binding beta-propeller fold protein YncE
MLAMAGGLVLGSVVAHASSEEISAAPPAVDSIFVLRVGNQAEEFVAPMAVAVDTVHREIVVANTGRSRVEFFDLKAFPLGWFVHQVPGDDGQRTNGSPRFVAADLEGNVLVSDLLVPWVDVVDYRGRPVTRLSLPAPDDTASADNGAGAIAVTPDGHILVASRGKQGRVYVFDRDYHYVSTWGTPGSKPGELSGITGMTVTPQGDVIVTAYATELAVQVFDAAGTFRHGFGVHDIGPGNFSVPAGVTVTADGRIWVVDSIRQNIQVFDSNGRFLGMLGAAGQGPGEFSNPSALASDGRGLLTVTEQMGRRLQLMWVN